MNADSPRIPFTNLFFNRSFNRCSKYVGGECVKYTLHPTLGEKARNNGHVVYSLDFTVTPHQLRHTYITNLIYASVDPKTVQYLAGHESSKITMDIYAKAKYNRPKDVAPMLEHVFDQWNDTSVQGDMRMASTLLSS